MNLGTLSRVSELKGTYSYIDFAMMEVDCLIWGCLVLPEALRCCSHMKGRISLIGCPETGVCSQIQNIVSKILRLTVAAANFVYAMIGGGHFWTLQYNHEIYVSLAGWLPGLVHDGGADGLIHDNEKATYSVAQTTSGHLVSFFSRANSLTIQNVLHPLFE